MREKKIPRSLLSPAKLKNTLAPAQYFNGAIVAIFLKIWTPVEVIFFCTNFG
jgi:hypothetical protein